MKANGSPPELDGLIHEPGRLRILAALYECATADFLFLSSLTGMTSGNFSTHMARLVKAGYVSETKTFVDRKPRTEYGITEHGRKAYKVYLKNLSLIIGAGG